MKNYLLFLLSFVAVSCIFLNGVKKSVAGNLPVEENQQIRAEVKPENDVKSVKRKTEKADALPPLQKHLDLSIPLQHSEMAGSEPEQQSQSENQENNLFAPPAKKNTQPLQLEGGWLMSQEPEAEKQKSVDGAGIFINLKP